MKEAPAIDWSGRFIDGHLEDRFVEPRFAATLRRARVGVAMVAALCFITAAVDPWTHPELVLQLLPNRLITASVAVLFFGPLRPLTTEALWIRSAFVLLLWPVTLGLQHVIRGDDASMIPVWATFAIVGVTLWRVFPVAWMPAVQAWTVMVLAGAGVWIGQADDVVSRELVSTIFVGAVLTWIGARQEAAERLQQFETWRATGLAESRQAVLAAVAHELRTPLAVARMAVGVAREFPERTIPLLERIDRRLIGLSALVDTVLELGSIEEVTHDEEVSMASLLREIGTDLRALDPNLEVEQNGEAIFTGDAALWRTALLNVAENAARFASSRIRFVLSEGTVRIEDDGPGVPEDQRTRIFEPMVRLVDDRGRHPGLGMGLALAARVVEAHGGSIRVETSELGGACFQVDAMQFETPVG